MLNNNPWEFRQNTKNIEQNVIVSWRNKSADSKLGLLTLDINKVNNSVVCELRFLQDKIWSDICKDHELFMLTTSTPNVIDGEVSSIYFKFNENNIGLLVKLFGIINCSESLKIIENEIYPAINQRTPSEIYESLYELIKNNDIALAKEQAIQYLDSGYIDAIWFLSEYLYDKGEMHEAFSLYQDIPATHPRYNAANLKLVDIIYGLFDDDSRNEIKMTKAEKEMYAKYQFIFSLNAGKEGQRLADLIFHAACGGKGLSSDLKNIKANEDTFNKIIPVINSLKKELSKYTTSGSEKNNTSLPSLSLFNERYKYTNQLKLTAENLLDLAAEIKMLREELKQYQAANQKSGVTPKWT